MNLTKEEEAILNGEYGIIKQKSMEIITALGNIYGANNLVPVSSTHLSGASYKTIGDGGLKYLEDMVTNGAKVSVKSTLNPIGMDRNNWKEMHISEQFAKKQNRIVDMYESMGVRTTCSCIPYTGPNVPNFGEHVAWSESSALSFVNSFIGARTNREGGPGALAAAIIGKTANYGLHITKNRKPTVIINAEIDESIFSYSLLGQAVGMTIGDGIPYFCGISPGLEEAKAISASMAASGSIALYHVEGITPEASKYDISDLETIYISKDDLDVAYDKLNNTDNVQLIAIGCPHLTEKEMHQISHFLKGKKKVNKDVEIWFCTSNDVRKKCEEDVRIMEQFGRVLTDTCMVVTPIEESFHSTGTNSAKAGNYLPTLCSQKVMFNDLIKLMEVVI